MLLIKNGIILTMVSETIENGQVLVDDGKIIAVGKDISVPVNSYIFTYKCIL